MANIIIRKPHSFGKTRSESEKNLRREWGVKSMNDEQLDKCKFLERKKKERDGSRKNFIGGHEIDEVK